VNDQTFAADAIAISRYFS